MSSGPNMIPPETEQGNPHKDAEYDYQRMRVGHLLIEEYPDEVIYVGDDQHAAEHQ